MKYNAGGKKKMEPSDSKEVMIAWKNSQVKWNNKIRSINAKIE